MVASFRSVVLVVALVTYVHTASALPIKLVLPFVVEVIFSHLTAYDLLFVSSQGSSAALFARGDGPGMSTEKGSPIDIGLKAADAYKKTQKEKELRAQDEARNKVGRAIRASMNTPAPVTPHPLAAVAKQGQEIRFQNKIAADKAKSKSRRVQKDASGACR